MGIRAPFIIKRWLARHQSKARQGKEKQSRNQAPPMCKKATKPLHTGQATQSQDKGI